MHARRISVYSFCFISLQFCSVAMYALLQLSLILCQDRHKKFRHNECILD